MASSTGSSGITIDSPATDSRIVKEGLSKFTIVKIIRMNSPTVLNRIAVNAENFTMFDKLARWLVTPLTIRSVCSGYAWHVDNACICFSSVR